MQSPDDSRRDPAAPSHAPQERPDEHPFGIVNTCVVAAMLVIALGAVAVECGFYKAFDDSWFALDGSVLSSVATMLGLGTSQASAAPPPRAPSP